MTEEGIRALAKGFLKKNNLYSFPVNLDKAAEVVGGIIIHEKLPKISGFVMKGDDPEFPYIIAVNIDKPYFHRKFTIAHEIGHILLNHLEKKVIFYEKNIFYNKNRFEWEANIFASELLVPTDKLKQLIFKNMSRKQMALFFAVSYEVMKNRIRSIGLPDI